MYRTQPSKWLAPMCGALLLVSHWASAQNAAYESGQQALQQRQWDKAVSAFEQVERAGGSDVDAALYWQAYAHYQANNPRRAQNVIKRLRERFPKSAWLDDARALEVEKSAATQDFRLSELDDELKVYALAALAEHDPERALPLVINLLKTSTDAEVRNHALFILTTNDSVEAQKIARELATDSSHPEQQQTAALLLADAGGEDNLRFLRNLYQSSANDELKSTILFALGNNDHVDMVIEMLKNETDPDLQASAIHALMNMEAVDQLRALDMSKLTQEGRRALIYALAETSSASPAIIEDLQRLYRSSDDRETKETILYAFSNSERGDLIGAILANESDGELQAAAIHALTNMDAYEPLRALTPHSLTPEGRAALVHAYAEMEDTPGLRKLLNDETDDDVRIHIIHRLGDIDGVDNTELLMDIYRRAAKGENDKIAVISALMAQDRIDPMIALLKEERDRDMQAQILSMLAHSDHPEAREFIFRALEQSQ